MISRLALLVALAALAVAGLALYVALGADDDADRQAADAGLDAATASETSPPSQGAASIPTSRADGSAPDEDAAADGASANPDPDGASLATTVALPGEPSEFGPSPGAVLSVVGVSHDDVLNVRNTPAGEIVATLDYQTGGPRHDVLIVRSAEARETIAEVDPWSDGVVATGRSRQLPTTIWHEVGVGGVRGWASGDYLSPLGMTVDLTSSILDIAGEAPTAPTLVELGLLIADMLARDGVADGAEVEPRKAVTGSPGVFEALGEVTVDLLDLPDDSLRGYRLRVFAHPGQEDWTQPDPGPFTLRTVEATLICRSHRGVTEEGLCI